MGVVYLGEHISLKRQVAIKILKPIFSEDSNLRDRFKNEGIALSKLSHPNIVILFDFIEYKGLLCMIMEFVEGNSLADILKMNNKPFDEIGFIPIFKKILNAFQYAHNRGIVHRDIKPSNILLNKEGEPKILDFGIAKIMESNLVMTSTGTKMGSLLYMSPEQILGKSVDYRTDIYSLGVTLFEVLTCKIPYEISTESDYEIQTKILRENLKPVNYYNPNLSPRINSIIQKATAKNPSDRFQSCDEFAKAFDDVNFTYQQKPYEKTVIQGMASSTTQGTVAYRQPMQGAYQYQREKRKTDLTLILVFSSVFILVVVFILVYFLFIKDQGSTKEKEKSLTEKQIPPQKDPKIDSPKITTSPYVPDDSPEGRIRTWIISLGNQEYRTAYEISGGSKWGNYDKFLWGYGCISKTYIYEVTTLREDYSSATVYADYDSYDPCNNDGRYKQFFYMLKRGGEWYIQKIKNDNIIYYRKK